MGAGDTRDHRRGRRAVAGLVALALLCGGVLVGRAVRPGARASTATQTVTVTAAGGGHQAHTPTAATTDRTRDGAAAAAGRYVAWLGGDAILDQARIRAAIAQVASRAA